MESNKLFNNIALFLAYDGGNYLGWQKTVHGPSIEQTLQEAIEQIVRHPVLLQAASRTDAGVHAKGQVVNFFTNKNLNLSQFKKSLNSLLPKDISVLDIKVMPQDFHPTLHSKGKEYHYYLCNDEAQLPWLSFFSWHYYYSLDVEKMQKAASYFIGCHDFGAFCNVKKNETYAHTIREIRSIEIISLEEKRFCFKICGNSFLYKMVRNIVGTIVYVGNGKIALHDLPTIMQEGDRTQAGMTAPARGLFLNRVFYD